MKMNLQMNGLRGASFLAAATASVLWLTGCGKSETAPPPLPVAKPAAVQTPVAPAAPVAVATPAPPAPGAPAAAPAAPAAPAEVAPAGPIKPLTDQDIQILNYAVIKYHEEFNRFPKSLQEMVGTPHLVRVPQTPPNQKLEYDPNNGQVHLVSK